MESVTNLSVYFSPEKLREAYIEYKQGKTDRFHDPACDDAPRVFIPMGADGVEWEDFEKDLDKNIRKISETVLEGKYYFYPFREKDIPKPGSSKLRTLSIATIRDVLVQKQLYRALGPLSEKKFTDPKILDHVSFGYRRQKSIHDAARGIWRSFKRDGFGYVLDADIQQFFDTLDHSRLEIVIDKWVGLETIEGSLLKRFIHTGRIPYAKYKGNRFNWKRNFKQHKFRADVRNYGIPQGGVLSGLLANLYLFEFDKWIVFELRKELKLDLRYYRYADDFVVLTRTKEDAEKIYEHINLKLCEYGLNIHPLEDGSKTKVVDFAVDGLEFLGFQFTNQHIRISSKNLRRFQNRFLDSIKREQTLLSVDTIEDRVEKCIFYYVNPKITGPQPEICSECKGYKDKFRSWISVFAPVVTDKNQIRDLDRWMRHRLGKYFFKNYNYRLSRKELKKAGMKNMLNHYYRRQKPLKLCQCHAIEMQ